MNNPSDNPSLTYVMEERPRLTPADRIRAKVRASVIAAHQRNEELERRQHRGAVRLLNMAKSVSQQAAAALATARTPQDAEPPIE